MNSDLWLANSLRHQWLLALFINGKKGFSGWMLFAFNQSSFLRFVFAINGIDGIDDAYDGGVDFEAGCKIFLRKQWVFALLDNGEKRVSGFAVLCFQPKQLVGDCLSIVRHCSRLCLPPSLKEVGAVKDGKPWFDEENRLLLVILALELAISIREYWVTY